MPQITVAGHAIEYCWIEAGDPGRTAPLPTLIFLHEGLGSIPQWRDFPARVAKATGCRALLYDRYGYGNSDVLAEDRVGVDFMHREAFAVLPEIVSKLEIDNPILVGHSDGASIALIYAGGHPARGVAVMAPHVFIEQICITSIVQARKQFETTDLPQRLGKYHRESWKTFYHWADAWLDPAFLAWNIEEYLPGIRCPVLAIQGEADEYGTMAQLDAIQRQVGGPCELLKLPQCGHSPHKDQPEKVVGAVGRFIRSIL